ncbi:hypothetical protein TNCV_3754641 [Trichonephila clavipes]|nr:hypothetical protein TNCV_3754641 [Trichonephila clavipes]
MRSEIRLTRVLIQKHRCESATQTNTHQTPSLEKAFLINVPSKNSRHLVCDDKQDMTDSQRANEEDSHGPESFDRPKDRKAADHRLIR